MIPSLLEVPRSKLKICPYCEKRISKTEEEAREQIGRSVALWKKQGEDLFAIHPYKCPHGYGWHVGRNPQTRKIDWRRGRTVNLDRSKIHERSD